MEKIEKQETQFALLILLYRSCDKQMPLLIGPRQANLVLITYASSEGSGEPAHPRSLARTSAARIGDKYQIRLTRPNWVVCGKPWRMRKKWDWSTTYWIKIKVSQSILNKD